MYHLGCSKMSLLFLKKWNKITNSSLTTFSKNDFHISCKNISVGFISTFFYTYCGLVQCYRIETQQKCGMIKASSNNNLLDTKDFGSLLEWMCCNNVIYWIESRDCQVSTGKLMLGRFLVTLLPMSYYHILDVKIWIS